MKVVPLFGDSIDKISGKIKFKISYEKSVSNDEFIGKETVYNVFLPKNGYLNYRL
jgi:hypothetical protein